MLIPLSGICMQDGLHREWFCTPQNMIKHECMFRSDLCPWIRNMCPSCWHNKLALSCTTSPFVKQFLDIFGPHPHYFCQTQSPPKKHRETRCPVTAVKLLVWVTQLLLVHQSFKRSSLSSAKSHEQRNDLHTKLGGPKLTFQGLLQALPTDNWLYTSLRRIKGPEGVSVLWYAMVLHMCGCCRRDTTTQNAYLVAEHRLCIKCSISAVRIKTEKRQIGFVTLDVDCCLEFATRAGSYSINIIIAINFWMQQAVWMSDCQSNYRLIQASPQTLAWHGVWPQTLSKYCPSRFQEWTWKDQSWSHSEAARFILLRARQQMLHWKLIFQMCRHRQRAPQHWKKCWPNDLVRLFVRFTLLPGNPCRNA